MHSGPTISGVALVKVGLNTVLSLNDVLNLDLGHDRLRYWTYHSHQQCLLAELSKRRVWTSLTRGLVFLNVLS
jgi:hypothetical protein